MVRSIALGIVELKIATNEDVSMVSQSYRGIWIGVGAGIQACGLASSRKSCLVDLA